MKVVALAGGVGGAKLADGLAQILSPDDFTVVVNTADDFEHLGLHISPDLDTVVYTLAGLSNDGTGWGRAGETWRFLDTLRGLGGPTWFQLGDRDLALHHERTRRLAQGERLSAVTGDLARRMGVKATVLPMTDDRVRTMVLTVDDELAFQRYFVERHCEPAVRGFRFEGIEAARPADGVLEALVAADAIVLCPSNPWVSLDPILAVPGLRPALGGKVVIGVSPIIGGRALKGPAAKMARELGIEPSAGAIAEHYRGVLTGLVIDELDVADVPRVEAAGVRGMTAHTVMKSKADRRRLANDVLGFARQLAG
ncbi:MAG: 2-phospho-L-lactate transferase [Anaerolineales bacterium]|nr:2-phospho-L-lactate transferase [Anaerolineales bacterium]